MTVYTDFGTSCQSDSGLNESNKSGKFARCQLNFAGLERPDLWSVATQNSPQKTSAAPGRRCGDARNGYSPKQAARRVGTGW